MSNRGRFTRSDPIHKNIERKEKRYLLVGPLNRALGIRRCINRAIQLNEDSFTAFTTGTIGVKTIRGVEIQSNANVKVPDFLKKKRIELYFLFSRKCVYKLWIYIYIFERRNGKEFFIF